MNKLKKILFKWNFKKIVIWYVVIAAVAGLICLGTVGYIYREKLNFAWQYSQLEEVKDETKLKSIVQKMADVSTDVVDILIVDKNNQIIFSANNSELQGEILTFSKLDSEKKYLTSDKYSNAIFQYVKSEQFMLNSIINKDFDKIYSSYGDESDFESILSSKKIYMLSCVRTHIDDNKVYVINAPIAVVGGMTALKITAAIAMLFFCIYWVLVALWLYKDAAKCKLSPLYWGLIGIFTNIIGLLVYMIYKHNLAICPTCGMGQDANHLYCTFCGTELGTRCEKCGSKIGINDNYCYHCGNKIK